MISVSSIKSDTTSLMEKTEHIKKEQKYTFSLVLKNTPNSITELDEELWTTLVEKVEVSHDKKCVGCFKNGYVAKIMHTLLK